MAIEFSCPQCAKLLKTSDEKAGLEAKCPGCGANVLVPGVRSFESKYPTDPTGEMISGSTKPCPMCGEQIQAAAIKCRFCGENLAAAPGAAQLRPHRGVLILVFSILSWVLTCFILGIVAWVMGNEDLREMAAGRMDPSGEGLTQAGKIIGMINVIVMAVIVLIWLTIVIFAIIAAALGNA